MEVPLSFSLSLEERTNELCRLTKKRSVPPKVGAQMRLHNAFGRRWQRHPVQFSGSARGTVEHDVLEVEEEVNGHGEARQARAVQLCQKSWLMK